MRLPYFSKYPYTNFEQLNIDFLLSTVSGFDARIKKNEEDINTLDGRVDGLEGRVDTAESDISDLKERVSGAESDISIINNKVNNIEIAVGAHELDISDLKQRMSTAEGTITAHGLMISNIQHDITSFYNMVSENYSDTYSYVVGDYCIYDKVFYKCISNTSGTFDTTKWQKVFIGEELTNLNLQDSTLSNQLDNLGTRVDNIPVVEANPGGTGTTLNTITIDNITYVIPSGGGGGGSSVTPNPSGTPTDDLISLDVDGTIYAIPSAVEGNGASAVTEGALTKLSIGSEVYSVQNLTVDDSLDDTSSNPITNAAVATALNDVASDYGVEVGSNTTVGASGSQDILTITLGAGSWLLFGRAGIIIDSGSSVIGSSQISLISGSSSVDIDDVIINNIGQNSTKTYVMKCFGIVELSESTTVKIRLTNYIQRAGNYAIQNIKLMKIRLK